MTAQPFILNATLATLSMPGFVPPSFHFLPSAEAVAADNAYVILSGIFTKAPRPNAALFDIDGTLVSEVTGQLIGRMVGAMYAFNNAGVPVGLFSVRHLPGIRLFLSKYPNISALIAGDPDGRRLLLDNDFFCAHLRALCENSARARVEIERVQSRIDLSAMMRIPVLYFRGKDGDEDRVEAPKLVSGDDVILIDNNNFRGRYDRIMGLLRGREDDVPALIDAVRHSLRLFWRVEEGPAGGNFTTAHIDGLVGILEGLVGSK